MTISKSQQNLFHIFKVFDQSLSHNLSFHMSHFFLISLVFALLSISSPFCILSFSPGPIVLSIENTLRSNERLIHHDVKYLSNYHNMVMLSCVHISFQNRIILNKNNIIWRLFYLFYYLHSNIVTYASDTCLVGSLTFKLKMTVTDNKWNSIEGLICVIEKLLCVVH